MSNSSQKLKTSVFSLNSHINVCENVSVDFDYKVDINEILELVENCSVDEREKILNLISTTEANDDDKILYVSDYVDVDFDHDLDFYDILELVENCTGDEKVQIVESIGINDNNFLGATNLYDEYKVKLLKEAFEKYTLEELQSRLELK